jgi:hypothetical protein
LACKRSRKHLIEGVGLADRCPSLWRQRDGAAAEALMRQWFWLKQYGVLPHGTGMDEQDPRFIEAVNLIESEIAAPQWRSTDGSKG